MDTFVQFPTVKFQLGLARATRAYRKFLLPHIGTLPNQPCSEIFELRQLHLQLAFMALCALRKNIQNQHGSVDHTSIQLGRQVAHLRGGKVVIKNDQRNFHTLRKFGDFLDFSATCKQRRVRALPLSFNNGDSTYPGGFGQQLQFLQALAVIILTKINTNQYCGLRCLTRHGLRITGG